MKQKYRVTITQKVEKVNDGPPESFDKMLGRLLDDYMQATGIWGCISLLVLFWGSVIGLPILLLSKGN